MPHTHYTYLLLTLPHTGTTELVYYCQQGHRTIKAASTGNLVERVKALNPDGAPYVQPFHQVRPIPQSQIDAVSNKAEFTQNPGNQ